MTVRSARHIFGRRGGFLIVAQLAVLSSLAGCSSTLSTNSENSSGKPVDTIDSPPDLFASAAGRSASTLRQTDAAQSAPTYASPTLVLPPSQISPQTSSVAASSHADSGPPVPVPQQSTVTNADILRSVYQSLKKGNECELPTDTC